MAPYVSYTEINRRYQQELSRGNSPSIADIRKILQAEKKAVSHQDFDLMSAETPTVSSKGNVSGGTSTGLRRNEIVDEYTRKNPDSLLTIKTGNDAVWDMVGMGIWQFSDIASFGTIPWLTRKTFGEEMIEAQLADWEDTKAGRIAGQVGSAVGFLRGMGAVKSGISKLGSRVFKGGTRDLQRKAGAKLAKDTNEMILKSGASNVANITQKQAQKMVHSMTDDAIAFGAKKSGIGARIQGFGTGIRTHFNPFKNTPYSATHLEHSAQYVKQARESLRLTVPDKLKGFLRNRNIHLDNSQILRLSDDIVEQVGRRPINNIDTWLANKFGNRLGATASHIVGGIAQESFDLFAVGMLQDAMPMLTGQLYPERNQSWGSFIGERMLHHGLTGAAFGGIRTAGAAIPFMAGGASLPLWRQYTAALDIRGANQHLKAFGGNVKGFNKYIKNKVNSIDEMKQVIKMTQKQNPNFILNVEGFAPIAKNSKLLERGVGLTQKNLPALKNAIINFNNKALSKMRSPKNLAAETAKDLIASSPRWVTGALVMNYAGLNSGMFDHMDPDEAAAHFILSAWMSKRAKPIPGKKTTSESGFGWTKGERPYFYNSEVNELYRTMQSEGLYMKNAEGLVKAFETSVWDSHIDKTSNRDIDQVLDILTKKGIIYNKNEFSEKHGKSEIEPDNTGDLLSIELSRYMVPIGANMRSRGYEVNPNAKKSQMKEALKMIENTKSSVLSNNESEMFLNSSERMHQSVVQSQSEAWNKTTIELFEHYRRQMQILTGKEKYVTDDGIVDNFVTFNSDKIPGEISPSAQRALSEFLQLQELLQSHGLIKINKVRMGTKAGRDVQEALEKNIEVFGEQHRLFSESLGKEIYGPNSLESIDITDPMLWQHISQNQFQKNVWNHYNVLFNNKKSLPADIDPAIVDDVERMMHNLLSPREYESDLKTIVNDVRNLKPDTRSEAQEQMNQLLSEPGGGREIAELQSMLHNLYSIMKTGKSGVPGKVDYNIMELRELKDKLIELGMPDPSGKRGAEDFRLWTQRMVTHGTNEALKGLEVSPEISYAINRLMENGLVVNTRGNTSLGSRLEMAREITADQILDFNKNLTKEQAQELSNAYASIVKAIPNKAVNKTEIFDMTMLSEDVLAAIRGAEFTINRTIHLEKAKELYEPQVELMMGLEEESQLLRSTIEKAEQSQSSPSEIQILKNRMQYIEQEGIMLSDWHHKFWNNIMGDVSRSAAFYHYVLNTKIGNKNISDLFSEIHVSRDKLSPETFDAISTKIKDLQVEISRKWLNRPEVLTSIEQQREESLIHYQAEEMEGRIKADNKRFISPDNFFAEYRTAKDIPMMEKVSNEVTNYGGDRKSYQTATEAMYDLYMNTAGIGNNLGFKSALKRIMGVDKSNTDKARNDIVGLHNLFERQFSTLNLQLNIGADNKSTSFTGVYNKKTITKSEFTDMYTEIFPGNELVILSDNILYGNKISTIRGGNLNDLGIFKRIHNTLHNKDFFATEQQAATKNQKHFIEGQETKIAGDMYENVDLTKQGFKGKQYLVGIDENINFLIPETEFHNLASKFREWYNDPNIGANSDYVRHAISKYNGAQRLYERLAEYNKYIEKSLDKNNVVRTELFRQQSNRYSTDELLNKAIHEMFTVMYGSRVDGDWLSSAYASGKELKDFKYKRLASNQGYARNSEQRGKFLQEVWNDGPTGYWGTVGGRRVWVKSNRNIVEDYAKYIDSSHPDFKKMEYMSIGDAEIVSETGKTATNVITDNRSLAENRLSEMLNQNIITSEQATYMMDQLQSAHSINAEANNAATVVRPNQMKYLALAGGQSQLIGETSGHKPVGVSHFTDAQGNVHVIYNKTHYFTDKRFDAVFERNPDVEQIILTSGSKKNKIINPRDPNLDNRLIPIVPPSTNDGVTLPEFLSRFSNMRYTDGSNGIGQLDFRQTLYGAMYGAPHEALVLKQLGNWSNNQVDIYRWSREGAVKQAGEATFDLLDPTQVKKASAFARKYLGTTGFKGSKHNPENENLSAAMVWIEGGGVPFSRISKNLYDNILKSHFIDDAGVFDGYTSFGGNPIVRPDFGMELNIPIYQEINGVKRQTMLGEANIGHDYLNRTIPFSGRFGDTGKEQRIKQNNYIKKNSAWQDLSTQTISFRMRGIEGFRDVIVDMKNTVVYDPLGEIRSFDALPQVQRELTQNLALQIRDGRLTAGRELQNELYRASQNKGLDGTALVALVSPSPRTGPHDLIPVKVKRILPSEEGGIVELNGYDLTLRAQRDFDTDKLPLYLDIPFTVVQEAYETNSRISEAQPLSESLLRKPKFDPYSSDDFWEHKGNIKDAAYIRGPVQKTSRRLDYMDRIFRDIGYIEIPNMDGTISRIKFNYNNEAHQRLVTDSQAILDPYAGVPKHIMDPKGWAENTYYGNSTKYKGEITTTADNPWFLTEIVKKGEQSGTEHIVSSRIHKQIVEKIMGDYGKLLALESGIWEAGEMKTPRYADIMAQMEYFRGEYHAKKIDWNFYNYLKYDKAININELNRIFFKDGNTENPIMPVFSKLSEAVNKMPTTFLKSMDGITQHNLIKVKEVKRPDGDFFNQGIQKWIGRYRGEMLEAIKAGKDITEDQSSMYTDRVDALWESFKKNEKSDQQLVQLNNIEWEISQLESMLSRSFQEKVEDTPSTLKMKEDLFLKRNALMALADKMMIDPNTYKVDGTLDNVEMIYSPSDSKETKKVFGSGVIRDSKTGKVLRKIHKSEDEIKKGEIFLKGGVQLVPVVEHEMLDAVALTRSLLGHYAHVTQGDMPVFRKIVNSTQSKIVKSMKETMEYSGYKDWSRHYSEVQRIIDNGLKEIVNLANEGMDAVNLRAEEQTTIGTYPKGKESYGQDFLLSLLIPKHEPMNDRTVYYNPKTSEFLPAMKNINKSVIDAVFSAMKNYNIMPDHNGFLRDLAREHKAQYEVLTAGDGWDKAAREMSESTFEGALTSGVVDRILHDPFMTRTEYKSLSENSELFSAVGSDFSELYRQMIQGSMTDPGTVFRLKSQLINKHGQKAYDAMFYSSRGQILSDGISGRVFGNNQGEGVLLGEVINPRAWRRYSAPIAPHKGKKSAPIRRLINEQVGVQNEQDNQIKGIGCD